MVTIPQPVKRQVRQEAGFGCCVCGFPIIEYHHIVKGSEKPEDIMLLCPNHHREATEGAMLIDEQRNHRSNPINIERGFVDGLLKINQKTLGVSMGTVQIIGEGDLIVIDGDAIISSRLNEGRLEISLKLYDKEDKLVAQIENNEWIFGDPLPWDLESKYQWIRIRRKLRDISFVLDARQYPINILADTWKNGYNLEITRDSVLFKEFDEFKVGLSHLCFVGGYIEIGTENPMFFRISLNPRFNKCIMVSEADTKKRVEKGLRHWELLVYNELRQIQKQCDHEFQIEDRGVERYLHQFCQKCGLVRVIDRT